MTEWQPIETAPRDRTQILVWDGRDISIALSGSFGAWHGTIGGELVAEYDGYLTYLKPTHWMPLPNAPVLR